MIFTLHRINGRHHAHRRVRHTRAVGADPACPRPASAQGVAELSPLVLRVCVSVCAGTPACGVLSRPVLLRRWCCCDAAPARWSPLCRMATPEGRSSGGTTRKGGASAGVLGGPQRRHLTLKQLEKVSRRSDGPAKCPRMSMWRDGATMQAESAHSLHRPPGVPAGPAWGRGGREETLGPGTVVRGWSRPAGQGQHCWGSKQTLHCGRVPWRPPHPSAGFPACTLSAKAGVACPSLTPG